MLRPRTAAFIRRGSIIEWKGEDNAAHTVADVYILHAMRAHTVADVCILHAMRATHDPAHC